MAQDAENSGTLNDQRPCIRISVRNLVEFILRSGSIDNRKKSSSDIDLMVEGARIHRTIQSKMGPDYHAEVPLSKLFCQETYDIIIEGRADGIIYNDDMTDVTIDEIKTTYRDVNKMEAAEPVHLAQAKCYAYIFSDQMELREITVRMTYVNRVDQQIGYFHERYTYREISSWFKGLFNSYKKWADREFEWSKIRTVSIKDLKFPFDYREGQKELLSQVYRTISHRKKLFLEAPTGTGKTISTVFPSVKAIGEGLCVKIFYLTAKTITRTVALKCFNILREAGLKFKTVTITAKEKICPLKELDCNPLACSFADGHFDRINEAIYDILINEDDFSKDRILEYALKHRVCPFELSLDLSLFSDGIICDYNYVFDPNVYLRRFFGDNLREDYIFLVDEAHNLVDRGMKMYSAELYKEDLMHIKNIVKEVDNRAGRALDSLNRKMLLIKRETEDVRVYEDISDFIRILNKALMRLDDMLEERESFEKRDEVLDFYFKIRHFVNMYDNMGDDDYVIYSELSEGSRLKLKLLCIDPSNSLNLRLMKARSTVFFSATLLPLQYYRDMLSRDEDDYTVYARSVFDESKRGLFIASDVSSKYSRRNEGEYRRVAAYISDITRVTPGNYMVFFPSHAFLTKVYEQYEKYYDSDLVKLIKQENNMTEEEREIFLNKFYVNQAPSTLIGFCVMGGIFAEGIDLKNDTLIGAIIVGTGLPMISNERQIMKKS
ncbi:MAG: ATP-dependent DNA helicase, partial [Lachnospiraceae bacterium]|nr:ATP-dependent DNA helicase [Lachnospiraceae bacterium]